MKTVSARRFASGFVGASRASHISLYGAVLLGLGAAFSASASAGQLVFDRGLPTANLNNAAGTSRSNVDWAVEVGPTENPISVSEGDNFTLSGPANYLINHIRVWVDGPPTTTASVFSLWFGTDAGASTSVSLITTSTSVTETSYINNQGYQGYSGTYYQLYQVDFTGLNLLRPDGTYAFGISGPADTGVTTPWLEASNASLSGSTQMGPDDGLIYGFTDAGLMNTANGYPWTSKDGWNKTSNINVQVFADVPEPASMLLLGFGTLGLGLVRRRRA